MRTRLFYYAVITAICSCLIGSCSKDVIPNNKPSSSEPFRIYVPLLQTKTINDGFSTKWVTGDRLAIHYAITGTKDYVKAGRFNIIDAETGMAEPNSSAPTLDENTSYDWYAFFRYDSNINPGSGGKALIIGCNPTGSQSQSGNDNMSHLSGLNSSSNAFPLFGSVKNVPGTEYPTIQMKNVASLVEYKVTNTIDKDIVITDITLESQESIVGYCNVAYDSEEPVITPTNASNTSVLNITDGSPIAKDRSACFYAGIFPCTMKSGSQIKVTVKVKDTDNNVDEQAFTLTLSEDIYFRSGKIKTLELKFNQQF